MTTSSVQYVKTSDGYNIAYRVTGSGTPLVFIGAPLTDINSVWQLFPKWLEGLAQRFQLVQFDSRGEGLSTRNLPPEIAAPDLERDLEAVVDHLGLERFLLWGWTARSHIAIRYANAHPDRVAGLLLNSCGADNTVWPTVLFRELPREDWETFLSVVTRAGKEEPSAEEARRRIVLFRGSISPENWDIQVNAMRFSNVEDVLPRLRVPALVMTVRNMPRFPESESMKVAALIPGARLVVIDFDFVFGDAAQGLAAIDAFVADLPPPEEQPSGPSATGVPNGLSDREMEVLRLLAAGKSNPEIAKELFITRNTVQNHVSSILIKTNLNNRAQAAVYAQQHGLV